MSKLRRIILVRHGETVGQSSIRYYGCTDLALSHEGRAQVRAAAKWLPREHPNEWVASSLHRAWESATLLANGRPIRLDADLREIDFGEWEGLTAGEIEASNPVLYREWQETRPYFEYPGGERRSDFLARIERGARRLFATRSSEVVLVAHKGVIRTICDLVAGDRLSNTQPPLGGVVQLTQRSNDTWHVGRRSSNPEGVPEIR